MITKSGNIWDPQNKWETSLHSNNKLECIGLMQIASWELLSKYLNGGIGHDWWMYPFKLGISNVLIDMAKSLILKWECFSEHFGEENPLINLKTKIDVELVLCRHYQSIETKLKQFSDEKSRLVFQYQNHQIEHSKIISRLLNNICQLRPYLHSYWFHGSIGSNEVKPGWSDFDGLAIISNSTFNCPENLRKLRLGLIKCRAYMIDFMPYQLHGHFILTESDLRSFPSCMFPSVLFESAQCVVAKTPFISLNERYDRRMAIEMLWKHGVKDIISIQPGGLKDTLKKIVFLHRLYFLPCLAFQVQNKPCFKKTAFKQLDKLFTSKEIQVFQKASKIWSDWQSPSTIAQIVSRIARLFRFNPLLYQAASHKIGKNIKWISCTSEIYWDTLLEDARVLAENLWQRTIDDREI